MEWGGGRKGGREKHTSGKHATSCLKQKQGDTKQLPLPLSHSFSPPSPSLPPSSPTHLNLFSILPTGVASKKAMGARSTDDSMPSWSFVEVHSPRKACPSVRK